MKHLTYDTDSLTSQKNEKIIKWETVPIKWQVLGWLTVVALFYFYKEYVKAPPFTHNLDFSIFIFYTIGTFYFNVTVLFPRAFKARRVLLRVSVYLFLEVIVILTVLIGLSVLFGNVEFSLKGDSTKIDIENLSGVLFFLFLGTILSFGYYGLMWGLGESRKINLKIAKIKALNDQNHLLEIDNLKRDLPRHFVINTLILLRYSAEHQPQIGVKCHTLFTEIMRFYSESTLDDLISLEQEMNQLRSYLEIHKLRLQKEVFLDVQYPEDLAYIEILPMLLLTLAENIIKYGVLLDSSKRAQIVIDIHGEELNIKALNWIAPLTKKVHSTRKGLCSLKKRLAHFHPNAHFFSAEQIEDCFEVEIRILLQDG